MLFFFMCHEFPAEQSVLQFTEKIYAALIKTVCSSVAAFISVPAIRMTQPMFSAIIEIPALRKNLLRDVPSLIPAQRGNISLKDKQGILVPWTIPVFIPQDSSTSEWIPQISGIYQMPLNSASDFSLVQLLHWPNCCKKVTLTSLLLQIKLTLTNGV